MSTVLVTGSNRGLGLEFVRQYAADNWRVHACCRNPQAAAELQALAKSYQPLIEIHELDVTDFAAIEALADRLRGTAIDVLINNAGVYGPKVRSENDPRQQFGMMDYDIWSMVIRTNTMGPLKMAEAFIEHVAMSEQKKLVYISSSLGSIARTDGGTYAYRSSKAAGNMVMATLARDVASRGISVLIFCPGWVKTAMGGKHALLEASDSVRHVRQLIAEATIEQSGKFIHYDGEPLPW